MRILIMTNAYEPSISGVVTSIKTFKQALVERGHEVFIFAPEYRHYDDGDPRIQRFPALDLSGVIDLAYALPYRQRMIEAARKISPDIVHAQHPSIMGDRAVDISRALGIPLVATFHCKYDDYARAFLPLLRGLVGNITRWQVGKFVICCNHIIVPAPNVSQWMEKPMRRTFPFRSCLRHWIFRFSSVPAGMSSSAILAFSARMPCCMLAGSQRKRTSTF